MEDPARAAFSKKQADVFTGIVAKLNAKGFAPITHISATSGILYSKDFHFDMSRAGIGLYGLWPSPEIERWAKGVSLAPALSWKTIVTEVKLVDRGERVGYDLTYETARDSRLAVIPIGYWHSFPRSMSGTNDRPGASVLVGGKRAKVVGRVSMDMSVIDVTDIPSVKIGDEVVIIGSQGKERVSAEEFAEKAGTINYEAVTRINPLIPRISS
jgi:alanine racemase